MRLTVQIVHGWIVLSTLPGWHLTLLQSIRPEHTKQVQGLSSSDVTCGCAIDDILQAIKSSMDSNQQMLCVWFIPEN